ncbi:peptide ABC transporter permease [Hypericibacter terrae]|jgi:oligopeptide transport system permease protein|uniref:Oligopeptide transport system permease protein OppC n=1 Tax=Hypericibacter terrae TaxID=2602015 RepID=A0A5J6MNC6_9PROT|nr:ABC transporter permease subunit [Hypericibacter terrae]QEX18879.1 peptide ABC transporter permease [Hypericibacter terrae]
MTDLAIPSAPARPRSLWADARRRLFRNRAAMLSLILLAAITLACMLAPLLAPHPMDEVNWDRIMAPPDWSLGYFFGTDENGRDLFARALYGGRVSLSIGAVATLVSLVIGVAWGAVAGFVGGRVDALMMRIVDILYALPFVFFVILLTVVFGRDVILMYVAIGAVSWLDMARIVRGQTLSLKRKEFIEAAHASGVGTFAILRRHIVPNTLGPVIIYTTLTVPQVILIESFVSFLGLGVQEPNASWGTMVNEGARVMETSYWVLVYPATLLVVTLLCLNFLGDGLRDALDPKDR